MNYSNNVFKHSHGKFMNKLERFIRENKDFTIVDTVYDPEIKNHRVGYLVKSKVMNQEIFMSAKSYVYNPSSVNEFVYEMCKERKINIAILYFNNIFRQPFENDKPQLYIYDINEVRKDSHTRQNIRFGYGQKSIMINFTIKLAANYEVLKKMILGS